MRHRPAAGLAALASVSLAAAALLGAAPAIAADTPVDAGIFVTKVEGLADDFALGVDVSSVLSLEASGVVFRDTSGAPADLFAVLASAGVTDVRVRVWNDPYDAQGHGYGGGTVDVPRAVAIGQRATAAGLRVTVDFHYSDFWADPGKQVAPKAWAGLDTAQKATALGDFTRDALTAFADAGVDVAMVQVGNETNGAMAGVGDLPGRLALYSAGSAAVREVFPAALVVLHFTNPSSADELLKKAAEVAGVDYDVFASSYYPYWHGTLANLTAQLSAIATTYGKKVMVAETGYPYTLEDGDGHQNSVNAGSGADLTYPVSVQGQATAIRDVIAAVASVGPAGVGAFVWEPAWLPVGPPSAWEQNRVLWERDGSGWATSYAGEYQADAAQWWGGSSWDNQALFDVQGHPLESLQVFRYVRTGAVAPLEVTGVEHPAVTVPDGEPVVLPATVRVDYNDGSHVDDPVTWSEAVSWIRGPGEYTVSGVTAGGLDTTATVAVQPVNYLVNPGFEAADAAPWVITGTGAGVQTTADSAEGARSVGFWDGSAYTFTVSQQLTGVPAGAYTLSATTQGGASPAGDVRTLGAVTSVGTFAGALELDGWRTWHTTVVDPVVVGDDGAVTVSASFTLSAGAWGTFDDVVLTPAVSSGTDTSDLDVALAVAAGVDRTEWSDASLAELDLAVEIGTVVLAGSRATQADVDAATDLITDALAGLVARVQNPGHNPDQNPGHNPDVNPGTNKDANPGHNRDVNPGHVGDQNPGHHRGSVRAW